MKMPSVRIDLGKLHDNARIVTALCARYGIRTAGVVKCCCGSPEVARVLENAGCDQIADSRIENIRKLREAGIRSELWLLRLPQKSEIRETVNCADLSLNSEADILQALSEEAVRQNKLHKVLLMIDLGDRREGVLPGDAVGLARFVTKLPGLVLSGIGTNLTCFGGIVPDEHNMQILAAAARQIRRELNVRLPVVSAGNSSSLEWMQSGRMPEEVNHLRLGESILLGKEACSGHRIPGTHDDVFTLQAEVIESAVKPSRTEGEAHLDAFGRRPQITDRGNRRRIILGIGREDIVPEGLSPETPGLLILGASSDHLIADAETLKSVPRPGDILSFRMNYPALLRAMTSEYVGREYIRDSKPVRYSGAHLICVPFAADASGAAMRQIAESLLTSGFAGDLPLQTLPEILHEPDSPAKAMEMISQSCLKAWKTGRRPYVIGGDHTAAAGLARAAVKKSPGAGWIVFSAHGDFHTRIRPGKCAAGTALSRVVGQGIAPDHLAVIGLQELEPDERESLRTSGCHVYTMEHIDRLGIAEVITRVLAVLRDSPELCIDLVANCLDLRGDHAGLRLREAHCAMEMLSDSGRVCGAVLSEFDSGEESSGKVGALLASLSGKKIL